MGNCKSTIYIPDGKFKSKREPLARSASITLHSDECDDPFFQTGAFSELDHGVASNEDPVSVIRNNIIGGSQSIATPFGTRKIVYADYTASGRCLKIVEDFINTNVYPYYANTHTEASATGAITTNLREEARLIVSKSLHAPRDKYAVFFAGTGCTGAIEKMMKILGIWIPEFVTKQSDLMADEDRPVVFIGPFEHHSNELPWRDSIATVVVIPEDEEGCPNINVLETKLSEYKDRRLKIGSFCAGSNVSGICIDTKKYSRVLHKHKALSFFDFAGSGAYVEINMNGESEAESMDAIFMSPHKFIGGPGCSGLLVAKRSIFKGITTPTFPGGGTVSFVSPDAQDYDDNIEAREDSGTPGIIQAIRTGMAFQVKEMVGCQRIEAIEREYCKMVFSRLADHPGVKLIGSDRGAYFDARRRVSIMSFNILSNIPVRAKASGLRAAVSDQRVMLHPHFVVAILNDVYGIQARAGCSCTGPYGHRLFDVDGETSDRVRALVGHGYNAFKPGWARVNFNYFISPEELEFICDAIIQIAEHGWKLLPLYQLDLKSALFIHGQKDIQLNRPSLTNFHIFTPNDPMISRKKEVEAPTFRQVLGDAKRIYGTVEKFLSSMDQDEVGSIAESMTSSDVFSRDDVWWVTASDVKGSFKTEQKPFASKSSWKVASSFKKDAWSIALEA